MTKVLDWGVDSDAGNIRESAIKLRSLVAENVYKPAFASQRYSEGFLASPRTAWRSRCLDKAEVFLGHRLSGTIVEIGAGTGWCSALLSKRESVERVYALDYDPVSVSELMPSVFASLDAKEEKITRVLGSYNDLRLENDTIDCVVSIGALHHSETLETTMEECFRVLRPGGLLVASEPCYSNSLTAAEQRRRENEILDSDKTEKLYGNSVGEIKAIDNSDHFYRVADFEVAGLRAGFDCYPFIFDATPESGGRFALWSRYLRARFGGDSLFRKRKTYNGFSQVISYPYFAEKRGGKPVYDALLLILVKPAD